MGLGVFSGRCLQYSRKDKIVQLEYRTMPYLTIDLQNLATSAAVRQGAQHISERKEYKKNQIKAKYKTIQSEL